MSAQSAARREPRHRGAIAWMARHRVAPNLLMLVLLLGGLLMGGQIRQEVFPEFSADAVAVSVAYPGASPSEVEQGVVLALEEAVRGVDDVAEVRATAREGSAQLTVEMREGGDFTRFYQDLRQAVDGVSTLPDDAEDPSLSAQGRTRPVLDIQLFGDADARALRSAAERVRAGLLAAEGVSEVELTGVSDPVVRIEISEARLRALGLSRTDLSRAIARGALDRAGGALETPDGDLLLRVKERRDGADDFRDLPVITGADGDVVRLRDVARVTDTFAESSNRAFFDGMPAIGVRVFRTGEETPIGVSEAARGALPGIMADLPSGLETRVLNDRSEVYAERVDLLLRNGFLGLLLVLGLLSLFLEFRLAFWVTVGIPTVFVGTMIFLPVLGVSLNMISLFAFILALGIVVDDAIVAGENIYEHRQRGESLVSSAIVGARDIAVPITFSILTNAVAFLPLAVVPGAIGSLWVVFPAVVVTALAISWVEALFILPAHLAYSRESKGAGPAARLQAAIAAGINRFAEGVYGRLLRLAMSLRYATIAVAFAILAVVVSIPASGTMPFVFLPTVAADSAEAEAVFGADAAERDVAAAARRLTEAARAVVDRNGGERVARGVYTEISETRVAVEVYLPGAETRAMEAGEFVRAWRAELGEIAAAELVRFSSQAGPGGGPGLTIRLSHKDPATLEAAGRRIAGALSGFQEVRDIDDGVGGGKPQIDLTLTAAGRALGLDAADLGAQVRAAYQGVAALSQQRGRNEVEVRIEAPARERDALGDLRDLMVRVPGGGEARLAEVARLSPGQAYEEIERLDGRRILEVTANIDPQDAVQRISSELDAGVLARLRSDTPGLEIGFGGRQQDQAEQLGSFGTTVPLALFLIYALLAIPLRSYVQPAIVMMAIPFGLVGAILGHVVMGYSLSIISMMGIIALAGVVVNGALVLIDYANRKRGEGMTPFDAAHRAGVRRFRPILLTTLTTFGGLVPMIFETSMQARFLIPMALSLGFGILFATAILLFLTPCLYMAVEDARRATARILSGRAGPDGERAAWNTPADTDPH